jgi:DNA-binding CsgD family transcriptional regulator
VTAETGGYGGVDPSSGTALCALVLGGAPIVRAGIAYLLQSEYAGRARIFSAQWQSRDRALAEYGAQLDLLVAYSDSDMTPKACWLYANGVKGTGVVLVVPPKMSEARLTVLRDAMVSIPFGAPLILWRKALHCAAKCRARLRSQSRAVVAQPPLMPLTERQVEVLEMLSLGLPNKIIASRLSLSVGTVKLHVAAVLRALHAKNRVDVVLRHAATLNDACRKFYEAERPVKTASLAQVRQPVYNSSVGVGPLVREYEDELASA